MQRHFMAGMRGLLVLAALALVAAGRPAAAQPLVDSAWVAANVGKPDVVFVDFRPAPDYLRAHIPGAVNSNYARDGWREERADKVPDMFPADVAKLAAMIGRLGIDNNTHVVLVPGGANSTEMGMGTRVYWTFKVLGHDKVSILNGGMADYLDLAKEKKYPLASGGVKPEPKTFTANLRREMLITMDDVKKAQAAGVLLVDNRPEDHFAAISRHGKAKAAGTIPGAKNLPQQWLTENGGGEFRAKSQLEQLYRVAGVPTSGEQINFCNTGHWASIGWFVSSELLGNKQAKLYDGSMVEWTIKDNPVEQRIKLQ
ncbi:MAG: sulfurtransferase [Burkholderiales bacterium]|nr:sulfurtransferase [Burkholderiales bacterium]